MDAFLSSLQLRGPGERYRRGVLAAVKAALASLGGCAGLDHRCALPGACKDAGPAAGLGDA
jgi:hypothetical protein